MDTLNRQLLRLVWPSLVENLSQTALAVVDMMMIGRLGKDAIAGIGLANQVMGLLTVAFIGLAMGSTVLVAQQIGSRRKKDAEEAAKQALILGVVFAFVVGLVGFSAGNRIIALLGAEAEVSRLGGAFLRIVSAGSITLMIMLIGGGALRGSGDTRTPMMITSAMNIINIGLAYVLIFGKLGLPALGVVGSATAITIARTFGSILILWTLFKRGSVLKLPWRGGWRLRRDVGFRIFNVGWPTGAEQGLFAIGLVIFSTMVVSLGTTEYASLQIAFSIASVSIMPAFAFSIAATTMVGQSLGGNNRKKAQESASRAFLFALILMSTMGLVFIIFRRYLLGFYTQDPDVIRLGMVSLAFVALAQPFQATSFVLGGALRGAGDTRWTMFSTSTSVWVMRVGVGVLLGLVLKMGFWGIWIGWMSDFILRSFLVAVRYRSGKWKEIKV